MNEFNDMIPIFLNSIGSNSKLCSHFINIFAMNISDVRQFEFLKRNIIIKSKFKQI